MKAETASQLTSVMAFMTQFTAKVQEAAEV